MSGTGEVSGKCTHHPGRTHLRSLPGQWVLLLPDQLSSVLKHDINSCEVSVHCPRAPVLDCDSSRRLQGTGVVSLGETMSC